MFSLKSDIISKMKVLRVIHINISWKKEPERFITSAYLLLSCSFGFCVVEVRSCYTLERTAKEDFNVDGAKPLGKP